MMQLAGRDAESPQALLLFVLPRWQEALNAGTLRRSCWATHEVCLAYCDLEDLKAHAVDADEAERG